MQLKDYLLKQLSNSDARKTFAEKVGTTWGYLQHVMNGRRSCSETLAINIEKETQGVVTCEELCPETDWEYIRNTSPTNDAA